MLKRDDRQAIKTFMQPGMKNAQFDENNAIILRLVDLSQKEKLENFKKKAKALFSGLQNALKKSAKHKNLSRGDIAFYRKILGKFIAGIKQDKRELIKSNLKKHISDAIKAVGIDDDKKVKDKIEKIGVDKLKAAADADGTKLQRQPGGKEPKVVKQETEKSSVNIIKWMITIIGVEGIRDFEISAKELFKDVLSGDKILSTSMNKSDNENKMMTAAIQKALVQLKHLGSNDDIDADYGPNTKAAVKKFQKANGLTQDGKVGRQTITAMFELVKGKKLSAVMPISGKEINDDLSKKLKDITSDQKLPLKKITVTDTEREVKLEENSTYHIDERILRYLVSENLRRKY
jgi:hypothetical protein